MQSKIRIEFDFDTNQPVLRITHAKESDDLRDTMLKAFIEKASFENSTMYVTYPQYSDIPTDNSIVEIRCEVNQNQKPVKTDENGFPRRSRLDLNTPAELAIHNAIQEVEKIGADIRLTNAQIKLQEAKDLVSDFIDEQSE